MIDEKDFQQLMKTVASIKPELENLRADVDSLRADVNNAEQKSEQRDEALRKEIRKLREQASWDRDRMEMLKNWVEGFLALGVEEQGPEPVQYVSTGTG